MNSNGDRFLSIDEAAQKLGLNAADLRHGVACGLVPMRQDNTGAVRVHCDEVPADLAQQLKSKQVDPQLMRTVYEGELGIVNSKLNQSNAWLNQLEQLAQRQSQTLDQSSAVLDRHKIKTAEQEGQLQALRDQLSKSEGESKRLSELLDRTFAAIEKREKIALAETGQLTGTTDRAMKLLQRAVEETEKSAGMQSTIQSNTDNVFEGAAVQRLEHEISQRNLVIDNQQKLMERLVVLSEKTVATPASRRRSFWQRLWGGGKGI